MTKRYTLLELATQFDVSYEGDPQAEVEGFDELKTATSSDISFLANPRYKEAMMQSQANIICICPQMERILGKNYLIDSNPSALFQKIISLFNNSLRMESGFKGIHPTAVIHPSAKIHPSAMIAPYTTIDRDVVIGEGTQIYAHVSIGPAVSIGDFCTIYPHVTVREGCILHHRVILQPGAVIGSCGYGYHTHQDRTHQKLEQVGIVVLEDDVEIGANTTIDRARFKKTVIKCGTKIDNLVQIGHNVEVGRHNLIVAQTGIAGSTKTGDHVIMGGQCGIVGHVEIPSHTILTTRSGVSKTLDKPGIYGGAPVMPLKEHNRQQVFLRKIEAFSKQLSAIEDQLNSLRTQAKA